MKDESAFVVGPSDEPDRFTLTHLLGSGGEGEVWRAVRTHGGGAEVAIKINRLPGRPDGAAERLRALIGVDLEGLVKVYDVFDGAGRRRADDDVIADPTHQYVVMSYVQGVTLRTWLDENPDGAPRERLRILRGVARTLSSLHAGHGGREAFSHGDIKPSNIIVGRDGRPVLVDLGLLRAAGSGPASGRTAAYSSPELRNPEATPSARTDTFSFAVTAMETLTALTPPLDIEGHLDLAVTRDRIRHSPALRTRPFVRRQLLRSLAVAPGDRPATPVRVFAARTLAAVLVPVVVLAGVGVGGAAVALGGEDVEPVVAAPGTDGTPRGEWPNPPFVSTGVGGIRVDAPRSRKPSPSATSGTPTPVHLRGNHLRGAMSGGTAIEYRDLDACVSMSNVVPVGDRMPASWGDAGFDLVLTSDETVRVLDVRQEPRRLRAQPALEQAFWIRCPEVGGVVEGCDGVGVADLRTTTRYLSDLDRTSFREVVGKDRRSFGVFGGKCKRPSVLELDTRNCSANVELVLTVEYQVLGDPSTTYTQTFEPVRSWGRMVGGTFTTVLRGLSRHPVPGFSSGPPGCGGRGMAARTPYRSARHEVEELVVQAVRERRRGNRLSLAAAIRQVAEDADSIVYDVDRLTALCQAARTGAGWRGSCGPADPPPSDDPTDPTDDPTDPSPAVPSD